MIFKKRKQAKLVYPNINQYIFSAEKIKAATTFIKDRMKIMANYQEYSNDYFNLCSDFIKIAYIIIEEKLEKYDYNYYLACLDALVEINYRIYTFECDTRIEYEDRKRLTKLFKRTRDAISTFSGIRPLIFWLALSVLTVSFISNITNAFLFNFVNVSNNNFVYNGISFIICIISGLAFLILLTPMLKKFLVKQRVFRSEQRNTLYQILAIVFMVFLVVWAFFFKLV